MKRFKAYTPSRRNMTVLDYSEITKKTPEKSLITTEKQRQYGSTSNWYRI